MIVQLSDDINEAAWQIPLVTALLGGIPKKGKKANEGKAKILCPNVAQHRIDYSGASFDWEINVKGQVVCASCLHLPEEDIEIMHGAVEEAVRARWRTCSHQKNKIGAQYLCRVCRIISAKLPPK